MASKVDKKINNEMIKELAKEFGYSFPQVKAVVLVESAGAGFDRNTGKIQIQFEPHYFKKQRIENGVGTQLIEWAAYLKAYTLNPHDAMMATSWGLGQIMGFNHKAAGYDTVEAMVNEFKISEYYQLKGMLSFISNNKTLRNALLNLDWKTFARLYNGPDYQRNNYDQKLANAYKKSLELRVHS